jgi:hypothetical protein
LLDEHFLKKVKQTRILQDYYLPIFDFWFSDY